MEFFQKAKDAVNCKKDDFFRMISEIKESLFWIKSSQKETLLIAKNNLVFYKCMVNLSKKSS
jgi:hypothetical protein